MGWVQEGRAGRACVRARVWWWWGTTRLGNGAQLGRRAAEPQPTAGNSCLPPAARHAGGEQGRPWRCGATARLAVSWVHAQHIPEGVLEHKGHVLPAPYHAVGDGVGERQRCLRHAAAPLGRQALGAHNKAPALGLKRRLRCCIGGAAHNAGKNGAREGVAREACQGEDGSAGLVTPRSPRPRFYQNIA